MLKQDKQWCHKLRYSETCANRHTAPLPAIVWSLLIVALLSRTIRAELKPDELLLIVNKSVPASAELAKFYSDARKVPDGRILQLDLPTGDEIGFDRYEFGVVPVVREFLAKNNLEGKVKCLVTFYGVPLRVAAHSPSVPEQAEIRKLTADLAAARKDADEKIREAEDLAAKRDPAFRPAVGDSVPVLQGRAEAARRSLGESTMRMAQDPKVPQSQKVDAAKDQIRLLTTLFGKIHMIQLRAAAAKDPAMLATARAELAKYNDQYVPLRNKRYDAESRAKLIELMKEWGGIVGQASVMHAELEYLSASSTGAALDNELCLLYWDYYQRGQWLANPMHYAFAGRAQAAPIMVMRLDGPTEESVRKLITTGIEVEKTGLKGNILIDAGGAKKLDPDKKKGGYWFYDEALKSFADVLTSAKVPHVYDDEPSLAPASSGKDLALYCGWYQLRNYQRGYSFVPGAVGFHVASGELWSLHGANESGWVHGLMKDGVVASLGPVMEPYLHSFPVPQDFFPLLMTGQLTLAETYWKTTPLSSWMISMIGDPLYKPFAVAPMLKVEQLPEKLRSALKK